MRSIRFGEGRIKVFHGQRDGVPIVVFMPLDKAHRIGETVGRCGEEVSAEEMENADAVVLEFPDYEGIDVVLQQVFGAWEEGKEKEWDVVADQEGGK